jgi:hypothetical protein
MVFDPITSHIYHFIPEQLDNPNGAHAHLQYAFKPDSSTIHHSLHLSELGCILFNKAEATTLPESFTIIYDTIRMSLITRS